VKTISDCISDTVCCAELDSFTCSLTILHNQQNSSLFLNHIFCLWTHLVLYFTFIAQKNRRCTITGAPFYCPG